MDRRQMISTSALAVGGFALGSAFTAPACFGKSIEAESAIVDSAILSLKGLLPAQAALLDKIGKLNRDFAAAYKRGDFVDAKAFFASLDQNIQTLIDDLDVNVSARIKLLVGIVGVAVRAIAALLNEQSTPAIVAAANAPAMQSRIQKLADPVAADKLLKSLKQ